VNCANTVIHNLGLYVFCILPSLGRLHGGGLGEGSFIGEPERWGLCGIYEMPCGRAFLYIGALLGTLEGVRLSGLLRKMFVNCANTVIHNLVLYVFCILPSLGRLHGGGLGEGSFIGGPERWGLCGIYEMPCGRAFLYIGALLGTLEGVRLSGLLRKMNSISEYLF